MTLHTVAAAGHSTGTVDTVDTVATVATVVAATSVMADSVTDMAMMVDSVDMVDTEGDSEGDTEGDTVIKGLICKLFFSILKQRIQKSACIQKGFRVHVLH